MQIVYILIKSPLVFQRLASQSITPAAYFFQKHFDNAQFESHREDGLRKLRSDAVPMVFDTLPAVMVVDSRMEHSKQGSGWIFVFPTTNYFCFELCLEQGR